jgi:hypothetical protein
MRLSIRVLVIEIAEVRAIKIARKLLIKVK